MNFMKNASRSELKTFVLTKRICPNLVGDMKKAGGAKAYFKKVYGSDEMASGVATACKAFLTFGAKNIVASTLGWSIG